MIRRLVFGKKYGGVFFYNYKNTSFEFYVSTRNSNVQYSPLNNGSYTNFVTAKNYDYTVNIPNYYLYDGSIRFSNGINGVENICAIKTIGGNSDVYSIYINNYGDGAHDSVYISDFKTFINQFPNLYSFGINIQGANCTIIGDLSQIPNSVESIHIKDTQMVSSTDLFMNLSNFNPSSKLRKFIKVINYMTGFRNIYGDLSKIPPLIEKFVLADNLANTFTYTAGRVWASSFDTLNLGNAKLSVTDTDNLLIDLNNSITTAIGGKVINLANCYRTSISDSAVAGLQAKGYTVTVNLAYSDVLYVNNTSYLAINNGTVTRTTDHKGGNTAIQFGSGNLVSVDALPASSVWSVSLWVNYKNTSTSGALLNLNDTANSNNKLLYMSAHARAINRFTVGSTNSPNGNYNEKNILLPNGNTWYHVVVIFDRSIVGHTNEIKFYLNKVLTASIASTGNVDQIGDFVSGKATIGSNTVGIATSPIKMFNYPLSQTEIDNLYNE